jgi:hypothetical protein
MDVLKRAKHKRFEGGDTKLSREEILKKQIKEA